MPSEALFQQYYRWGVRTATNFARSKSVSAADLPICVNSGLIALWDCTKRYIPTKGNFAAYARCRISGAVLDTMRELDPLSRSLRRTCAAKGLPPPRVWSITEGARDRGTDMSWRDINEWGDEHANDEAVRSEAAEVGRLLLRCLTDPDRRLVVILIDGSVTARAYAEQLGVNETRVSQRFHEAILALRRAAAERGLIENPEALPSPDRRG